MTQQQAIALVYEVVQGERHKYYHYNLKKAKEYKAFITGEGIDEYIPQFKRREDESSYKQRKEITVNITPSICGNVIDPQYKLPRSNSIENRLFYTDKDNEKEKQLRAILSKFYKDKPLDAYMGKDWIELNNIDPNAFIVLDWKFNDQGQRIKPYPVEYGSANVLNFQEIHGELQWLCVHRPESGSDPETYILYTKNFTVVVKRKEEKNELKDVTFYKKFPLDNFQDRVASFPNDNSSYYEVYVSKPHNLGFVPARQVGFVTDQRDRTTYVSIIHKCLPRLKKIVKSNSELDLILSLHTFPQKIQYADPCPECNGAGRDVNGVICTVCKGTLIDKSNVHSSSTDVLYIPRPRDKEEQMDLSKMIHYVKYDVELFKAVDEFVDRQARKCKEDVYNSEVFTRGNVPETAYQKNIDLQNVYDSLWPMAQAYAAAYNFFVEAIAKITKLDKELVHNMSFRKDFKMKSLTDLYQDELLLNNANAPEFMRRGTHDDIAQIIYEDDPRELQKYYTTQHFYPFTGKTEKEIEAILMTPNLVPNKVRVLWANFSYIFDELEYEFKKKNIDFYLMPRDQQKVEVDNMVDSLINIIASEQDIQLYAEPEGDT